MSRATSFAVTAALLAAFLQPTVGRAADATKKDAEKRFKKLEEYCKERRVTQVVELMVEWREFTDHDQREVVLGMVNDIFEDVVAARGQPKDKDGKPLAPHRRPVLKFGGTVTGGERKFASGHTYYGETLVLTPTEGADPRQYAWVREQLVVASRRLEVGDGWPGVEACVVLSNAETAEFDSLDGTLVITSGRVRLGQLSATDSDVVAGGEVQMRKPSWTLAVSGVGVIDEKGNALKDSERDQTRILANDKKLLGVKFYSTAEDGLEGTAKKGVVTVAKVDAKKAFGKAGVREGDVIESINGEKVPSLHELDRLICRATVASGVAKLKVKRGEKSEEVEVPLFDWSSYTPHKKDEKK